MTLRPITKLDKLRHLDQPTPQPTPPRCSQCNGPAGLGRGYAFDGQPDGTTFCSDTCAILYTLEGTTTNE